MSLCGIRAPAPAWVVAGRMATRVSFPPGVRSAVSDPRGRALADGVAPAVEVSALGAHPGASTDGCLPELPGPLPGLGIQDWTDVLAVPAWGQMAVVRACRTGAAGLAAAWAAAGVLSANAPARSAASSCAVPEAARRSSAAPQARLALEAE